MRISLSFTNTGFVFLASSYVNYSKYNYLEQHFR